MARPRKKGSEWRPPNTMVDHGIIYHRPTRVRLGVQGDPHSLIWQRYEEIIGEAEAETLRSLIDQYLESQKFQRLAPRTQIDYRKYFDRICARLIFIGTNEARLGSAPLHLINVMVFQAYLDKRGSEGSPVAGNREMKAMSSAFKWAYPRGLTQSMQVANPCKGLEWHKETPRTREIQQWEYDLVLNTARQDYIKIAMELAYLCVCRCGEILHLNLRQITEEGVKIVRTKGSKTNIVEWTPRLRSAINRATEYRSKFGVVGMTLVVNEKGQRVRESTFQTAWQRTMRRALANGLKEPFTFHDIKAFGYTHNPAGHKAAGHQTDQSRVYQRGDETVEATE